MAAPEVLSAVRRILDAFVAEVLPGGGIDRQRSLWQAPGRGFGEGLFPGGVDIRYLRFLIEDLYRVADVTSEGSYRAVAESHCRFMAEAVGAGTPSWAWGNALEGIGLHRCFSPDQPPLTDRAREILGWLQGRRVRITTTDGVSFWHYPCGYGAPGAVDAGWTNDLSMVGSGLVWAYELLGEEEILADAVSYAEYFVQPWRPDSLGDDGYWHCGAFREDLGSWVIGPPHFSGVESTDAYTDEVSWVFSTMTCTDYLMRLHRHHPDPRYVERCVAAAEWTFDCCQFEEGAVGMCGRDDKWLGLTGNAVSQVAMILPALGPEAADLRSRLTDRAHRAMGYLLSRLPQADLADHGVEWVNRTTSTDPLVNVGMLWAAAVLGWLSGRSLSR